MWKERAVADVENEISRDGLEISNATTCVRNLQDILDNINAVIQQKNATISKIENEIVKGTIDQQSKKIDALLSKEGVSQNQ